MSGTCPQLANRARESGQGTVLAVFILGLVIAMFSWFASASLERRQNEAALLARKMNLRNAELKLAMAFYSPDFANKKFFKAIP